MNPMMKACGTKINKQDIKLNLQNKLEKNLITSRVPSIFVSPIFFFFLCGKLFFSTQILGIRT